MLLPSFADIRRGLTSFRKVLTRPFKKPKNNIVLPQPNLSPEVDQNSKYYVFLGGTCGSSTWRQEVAIPILELNSITSYYNPQVLNWTPDLVKKEAKVKNNSICLVFVFTRETPSVASLVEAAYYLGLQSSKKEFRKVFICLEPVSFEDELEFIRQVTKEDLHRAWTYFKDIIKEEEKIKNKGIKRLLSFKLGKTSCPQMSEKEMMKAAFNKGKKKSSFDTENDYLIAKTPREYLLLLAEQSGVEVFDNIPKMMNQVVASEWWLTMLNS